MSKCALHPGRDSVSTIFGRNYCQACQNGITSARSRVDRHVQPKDCFIWYVSNDNWQPITGTGCAHWVAHQLNIQTGTAGDRCLGGFTYRVAVLVRSRTPVASVSQVKVNDIWASPPLDHTGLVVRVVPPAKAGGSSTITIRHDSSHQHQVVENDFATFFHGHGSFYR
jgi:hypothetical protein